MADGKIDLGGLPIVAPGSRDYLVGTQLGAARRWPLPSVLNASALITDAIDGVVASAEADASAVLGGLGYLPPVPYAEGLSVSTSRFTVSQGGQVYAPVSWPFTTGASFNPTQWRLLQGVTGADLAADSGARMVGVRQSGSGAVRRDLGDKASESKSVLDFIPVEHHAAIQARASTYDCTADVSKAIAAHDDLLWPTGKYRVTAALKLRSGLRMHAQGSVLIESVTPAGFESAIFAVGNIGRIEANALTYRAVNPPQAGATALALTTPGESANFAPGDFVFVRGGSYYTSGGQNYYEFGTINRVAASAGGLVTLKYAIDEALTSCEIGNITQSGLTSPVTGDALFACEGVQLSGFSLKTNGEAGIFREGGGALNCVFDFRDVECDSFAYNNAFAHSTIRADRVTFIEHLWELGVNSHHVETSIGYAKMTGAGVVNKRPLRTSENGRHLKLAIRYLDLGAYAAADVPIYLDSARDCHVDIDHMVAPNVTTRLITINSQAFAPTAPRVERITARVGRGYGGALQRYVTYSNAGGALQDCAVVDSRFYGSVSSGAMQIGGARPRVRNVWCENGVLDYLAGTTDERVTDSHFAGGIAAAALAAASKRGVYKGNTDNGLLAAVAQNHRQGFSEITSTNPANTFMAQTFPPGTLKVGDVLRYEIAGQVNTATATAKSVEGYIGATKVVDIQFGSAETGPFVISGEIDVSSLTALSYGFICPNAAAASPNVAADGVSVSSLATSPLTIEWRGYKAAAAGSLFIRYARAWIERHGN